MTSVFRDPTAQLTGRCRKQPLRRARHKLINGPRLQALVYDVLPSTPSTGLRRPSFNSEHWFTTSFLQLQALVYDILPSTPSTGLRHPSFNSKHWFTTSFLQLQALVYDILPSTPSTGLRHPSFNSKHWFTTSFLQPLPYLVR